MELRGPRPAGGLFQKCEVLRGVHMALASSSERDFFLLKTSHLLSITNAFPEARRVFTNDADMANRRKKLAPDILGWRCSGSMAR
jgi:hypothetical protein